MHFPKTLLLLAVVPIVLSGCHRDDTRTTIAVINSKQVVTTCNAGIRIVQEIQKQFAARRQALKDEQEALRKLQADPAVNDPKSGRKAALQARLQQFVRDSQALRQDVAEAEAEKFRPVVDKINKVLADYAKEHGLVGVQDKAGFAYLDPSIDITQAIIKRVDALP